MKPCELSVLACVQEYVRVRVCRVSGGRMPRSKGARVTTDRSTPLHNCGYKK